MHGLGNDFMMIDGVTHPVTLSPQQIQTWSQRRTGIGFDQCLLLEKSAIPDIDFMYRIFNADGQEVGQCGNGARCLALFIQRQGLSAKKELRVKTSTSTLHLSIHEDQTVTVNFGIPDLLPAHIPTTARDQKIWYQITINQEPYQFHSIQIGNPHAVLVVDDLQHTDVATIGQAISTHSFFPEQANVGFLQIVAPEKIALRVFERGCGETQACGSGAVAAAALGILYHELADNVTVTLPGGELHVSWPDKKGVIYLRGPATFVYDGKVEEGTCESLS